MKNRIARVLEQSYGPFPDGQVEKMATHITNTNTISSTSIGWVPIDHTGEVYQATVSNRYNAMFDPKNRKPTRKAVRKLYSTEKRAASYSPVGKAKEVFIL